MVICGQKRHDEKLNLITVYINDTGQSNEMLGLTMTMEQVMVTAAMPPWEMVAFL